MAPTRKTQKTPPAVGATKTRAAAKPKAARRAAKKSASKRPAGKPKTAAQAGRAKAPAVRKPGAAYDVIVIGSGSVGVPAAYYLAARGAKVLVLEHYPASGQGQNKSAIGGVRATHSDPAKILLCKESLFLFEKVQKDHGIHIGFKPGGYCFPVFTEKIETTLKGILPIQKSYGLEIDWYGPEEIQRIVPGIREQGLKGGTFSPKDAQVSPLLAAYAFEVLAKNRGAEFRFNEPVTSIGIARGAVRSVSTSAGTYSAGNIVIAAGAEAREVGSLAGLDLPVTPDSHEAGITAPVAHFLGPLIVDLRPGIEGKTANFYFGQNAEGQIIFCYTPKDLFVGKERENLSEFMPIVARRLIDLIPRLKNLLVRRIWRGLYPMTPDGVPIIDRVEEIRGMVLAVGMCGQGFMLGPGVGLNVAALVLDGRMLLPPEVAHTLRFKRDFYAARKEALK